MTKSHTNDLDVEKGSPPTYDDILNICEEMHVAYKLTKKNLYSLSKEFTSL